MKTRNPVYNKEDVYVNERLRTIHFISGRVLTLNNVTLFNSAGSMLRLMSDEGYTLVNPSQIETITIDGERVR